MSSGASLSLPDGLLGPHELVRELGDRPNPVYVVRQSGAGAGAKAMLAVAERFAGVMKTLRPLWTLVLRNTFPSRLTGSFRTGDNVLIFVLRRGITPPMIRAFKLHIEMCSPRALLLYYPVR